MSHKTKVEITAAKNGFILVVNGGESSQPTYIYTKRRQLMHAIGRQLDELAAEMVVDKEKTSGDQA